MLTTAHHADVVIVGAGVAGLSAAHQLTGAGVTVGVLEAAPQVGGRMATEEVDGFRLDRIGQVLSTAYPELLRTPGLEGLALRTFSPGVLVHSEGRHYRAGEAGSARGALSAACAPWQAPRGPRSAVHSTRPASAARSGGSRPPRYAAWRPAPSGPPPRPCPGAGCRPVRSTVSCARCCRRCSATRTSPPPAGAPTSRCAASHAAGCAYRRAGHPRCPSCWPPRCRREPCVRAYG